MPHAKDMVNNLKGDEKVRFNETIKSYTKKEHKNNDFLFDKSSKEFLMKNSES